MSIIPVYEPQALGVLARTPVDASFASIATRVSAVEAQRGSVVSTYAGIAAAFAAIGAATLYFGPGTYADGGGTTIAPPEGAVASLDKSAKLVNPLVGTPVIKGNRFTYAGDYEASLPQLNHFSNTGLSPANVGTSAKNALAVFRGSATAPDLTAIYANTAQYIEMHFGNLIAQACSVWGNPYKVGALAVEIQAHGNAGGEVNAITGRSYATDAPLTRDQLRDILQGGSFVAQSNTGAGKNGWNLWALNLVAAQTSGGTGSAACQVGVETDIISLQSAPTYTPGTAGAFNSTAYWAQSGANGVACNTAFLASSIGATAGWQYGIVVQAPVFTYLGYLATSINSPTAQGLFLQTLYGDASCAILDCYQSGNEQFRVDGNSQNAVSMRLNSQLQRVTTAALTVGGATYKVLTVPS